MVARGHAKPGVAINNARGPAGNRDVGQQTGHQACAYRWPVDGAHNGFVAVDQVVDQVACLFPDPAAQLEIIGHVLHQRQVTAAREAQALAAQHGTAHTVIGADIAPDFAQFKMPLVASGGQLAVAAGAVRAHLDVQHRLIGAAAADVQGLVTAVVHGWPWGLLESTSALGGSGRRHNHLLNGAKYTAAVGTLHIDADGVAVFHELSAGLAVLYGFDGALFGDAAVAVAPVLVADSA